MISSRTLGLNIDSLAVGLNVDTALFTITVTCPVSLATEVLRSISALPQVLPRQRVLHL